MPDLSKIAREADPLLDLEREIVWFLGDAPEDLPTILNHLSRSSQHLAPSELEASFENAVHELWQKGLVSVCRYQSESEVSRSFEEPSTRLLESVRCNQTERRWIRKQIAAQNGQTVISLTPKGYRQCGF